jgi:predicted ester cyclase
MIAENDTKYPATFFRREGMAELEAMKAQAEVEAEPVRGRKAIAENQAAFLRAMPDISMEFTLILISGNHIAFEGIFKGTFTGPLASPEGDIPPTGRSVKAGFAFIARVNTDGLVEEDRTYFDNLDFMKQLGLIE